MVNWLNGKLRSSSTKHVLHAQNLLTRREQQQTVLHWVTIGTPIKSDVDPHSSIVVCNVVGHCWIVVIIHVSIGVNWRSFSWILLEDNKFNDGLLNPLCNHCSSNRCCCCTYVTHLWIVPSVVGLHLLLCKEKTNDVMVDTLLPNHTQWAHWIKWNIAQ